MAKHGVHGGDGGHGDTEDGDDPITVRRGDINRIDCTITALLAERMRIGRELGQLKRSRAQPARSEAREADVLVRVRAAAARPLSPSSAERIFLAIIEETAACQDRDSREDTAMPNSEGPVAYQGAPGAFSEDAALHLCGPGTTLRPCRTLDDVFRALAQGEAVAAVIPVENSIAGDVPGSRALVAQHQARIRKTVVLPIVHALVAASTIPLDDVREVHSHPMALAQCGRFLAAHPRMVSVPAFDTAGALAELMRQSSRSAAAIASRRAAAQWGGVVLLDGIQDRADNVTEFWLVTVAGGLKPADYSEIRSVNATGHGV